MATTLQVQAEQHPLGPEMTIRRCLPTGALEAVGPFVFLDHLGPMPIPHGMTGIPAHPHAGIEVLTYFMEGSGEHRDSLGNVSVLDSGGAQWARAGRGMLHAERPFPSLAGNFHAVQLWARLPAALDDSLPEYHAISPSAVPEFDCNGCAVRLLAGTLSALCGTSQGPVKLASPALLLHVTLEASRRLLLPLDPIEELAVYVLAGQFRLTPDTQLPQHTLTFLESPRAIELENLSPESSASVLVLGGQRAMRPLVFHGSFVFSSPEKALATEKAYHRGELGTSADVPPTQH